MPNQHHNQVPNKPAPGGATTEKRGIRERLRERFKEKPATREEIEQLKLDTEREKYKTEKYKHKHGRPSAIQRVMGGGSQQVSRRPVGRPSLGRGSSGPTFGGGAASLLNSTPSYANKNQSSWGSGLNSLLGSGNMMDKNKRPVGRPKQMKPQKPFGSGLNDLFSI